MTTWKGKGGVGAHSSSARRSVTKVYAQPSSTVSALQKKSHDSSWF